jgi:benzoate/toluate 1,2-dioxygenase subunit alpha
MQAAHVRAWTTSVEASTDAARVAATRRSKRRIVIDVAVIGRKPKLRQAASKEPSISQAELRSLVDERPKEGIFRINRRAFTDERILDLEQKYIFERTWIFLAHESQLPNANDFLTCHLGRQPVILTRTADGKIHALLNTCTHRGSTIELNKCGNKKLFMCPFHAWSFRNDGKLMSCGETELIGYSPEFRKASHDLARAPKVASYRGFIFASLSDDVPELEEFLGDARRFIDIIVDQDPNGELEVVPGVHTYTYSGNWKLQVENNVDAYHVAPIHANYIATTQNRQQIAKGREVVDAVDLTRIGIGGYSTFDNGHVFMWQGTPSSHIRPVSAQREHLSEKFGSELADWVIKSLRNLSLFPNTVIMDQIQLQIRTFRPLSVDRTLVTTMAFAPKSDTPEVRALRLRQYEDFFNASGLATPDDLAAFGAMQRGFEARTVEWSDISRRSRRPPGDGPPLGELGVSPRDSANHQQDEGIYLTQHHMWLDALCKGMSLEADLKEAAE